MFNISAEEIMNNALEYETIRVKVDGIYINNIRHADDTAMITINLEEL